MFYNIFIMNNGYKIARRKTKELKSPGDQSSEFRGETQKQQQSQVKDSK